MLVSGGVSFIEAGFAISAALADEHRNKTNQCETSAETNMHNYTSNPLRL